MEQRLQLYQVCSYIAEQKARPERLHTVRFNKMFGLLIITYSVSVCQSANHTRNRRS